MPLKPTPCQQEYEAKMLKRAKQMSQVNSAQAASDREEVTKRSSAFKNRTVDCKHQLRQDAIQTLGNDPNYFTESLKTNNQGMVARACIFSIWEVAARESKSSRPSSVTQQVQFKVTWDPISTKQEGNQVQF